MVVLFLQDLEGYKLRGSRRGWLVRWGWRLGVLQSVVSVHGDDHLKFSITHFLKVTEKHTPSTLAREFLDFLASGLK